MVEVTITTEQKVKATLVPVTATGKPAKLDGLPTWTVVNGDSTLSIAADGLSADLISSDISGSTEISIKADADLGSGVEEISDTILLKVQGAKASNLGLTLGVPEAK